MLFVDEFYLHTSTVISAEVILKWGADATANSKRSLKT